MYLKSLYEVTNLQDHQKRLNLLYIDDIKVYAKKNFKEKQTTGDPDTNNKNILPEYKNGILL